MSVTQATGVFYFGRELARLKCRTPTINVGGAGSGRIVSQQHDHTTFRDARQAVAMMRVLNTALPGTQRADVRPFNRTASAALDDLIVQLERNPGRWRKRILRLRKIIWERRALGRAA